jgi:hypothetical protein
MVKVKVEININKCFIFFMLLQLLVVLFGIICFLCLKRENKFIDIKFIFSLLSFNSYE